MNRHRTAAGLRLGASADSLSQAPRDCACRKGRVRRIVATALFLGAGTFAVADDGDNIYQAYTDEELSEVASGWESMTTEERRDYSLEIRRRMTEAGKSVEVSPEVGERRFGRIIPQPDGSVLRIEGVVRYRRGGDAQAESAPGYGTGFEQRVEQTAEQQPPSSVTAPVVTVNGIPQTEVIPEQGDLEATTSEHGEGAQGRE